MAKANKQKSKKNKEIKAKLKELRKSGKLRNDKGQFTSESAAYFGQIGGKNKKGSLSLVSMLRRKLEDTPEGHQQTYAELLINRWISKAIKDGDFQALREVVRYIDGKPEEQHNLSIKVDNPYDKLPLEAKKKMKKIEDEYKQD